MYEVLLLYKRKYKYIFMRQFYFSFGQSHYTNDGTPLFHYYVRVTAPDYMKARYDFVEKFSKIYLPRPDAWCWQYEEEDFDHTYFSKGEYTHIKHEE